ncbi:MAG: universal stress protein [Gemmatimonadota bacterium]
MATQGRGLSRVFVGSVADKLVRTAGRPVLVPRPGNRAKG